MLSYLELCAASVADQEGVEFEHIVVDGASSDGTVQWLQKNKHIKSISEKDNGMYDALNKGLKMAKGGILGYLNCDEQYLPGTPAFVKHYFETHPDVDILFGGALLIRPDGSLIAFRKSYPARWTYIAASHLYLQSCSMFFRRKIVEKGFFFDSRYRSIGDEEFVIRLLRNGFKPAHVNRYLGAFTMTGQNLSIDSRALEEKKMLLQSIPAAVKILRKPLTAVRLMEKLLGGAYGQGKPIEYAVYTSAESSKPGEARKQFLVHRASSKWKWQ
jgi:glycosyltransferase involved in cell wall biosynthesis